jgi:hypothetical protein
MRMLVGCRQQRFPALLTILKDLVRNADIPEVLRSKNSLYPSEPRKIPLGEGSSLTPGGEAMLSIVLNAPRATADASLYLLFVYREVRSTFLLNIHICLISILVLGEWRYILLCTPQAALQHRAPCRSFCFGAPGPYG